MSCWKFEEAAVPYLDSYGTEHWTFAQHDYPQQTGKHNYSLGFLADDPHTFEPVIWISGNTSTFALQNISMSAWIKLMSGTWYHNRTIFYYASDDGQYWSRSYEMFFGNDRTGESPVLHFAMRENDYTYHDIMSSSGTTFDDGSWHHVVVTVELINNTFTVNMYVDGNLDSKSPQYIYAPHSAYGINRQGLSAGNVVLNRPGYYAGDSSLLGSIDTAMIWNRPITAAEVTTLWNGGAGRDCS
jgi:hypothetical protein